MKKLSTITLMLAVLLRWAVPAIAQGPWGTGGGPRGHHMMGGGTGMMLHLVLRKLTPPLTDGQKAQVDGIMQTYRSQTLPLFPLIHSLRQGMISQFYTSDNPTIDSFVSQTQQLSDLQKQIMTAGLQADLAIRAVLTHDQLIQAAQIVSQMQTMQAQMYSFFEGQ